MIESIKLQERSDSKCELCGSGEMVSSMAVAPKLGAHEDEQIVICDTCKSQVDGSVDADENHWRCLNESMWSQVPAVQVVAYRMLQRLNQTNWAPDLIGMMYLDEEILEWANAKGGEKVIHKDSNGNILQAGDAVTLIQDLKVKGGNFTAKRGVSVRNIRLVPDNANHIEGKVEGQQIVILTQYVKKNA